MPSVPCPSSVSSLIEGVDGQRARLRAPTPRSRRARRRTARPSRRGPRRSCGFARIFAGEAVVRDEDFRPTRRASSRRRRPPRRDCRPRRRRPRPRDVPGQQVRESAARLERARVLEQFELEARSRAAARPKSAPPLRRRACGGCEAGLAVDLLDTFPADYRAGYAHHDSSALPRRPGFD